MNASEFQRFGDVVNGVMDVYGRERSATAVALWWKVLQRFSLADVEAALAQHMHTSRFAPTPADVVTCLQERDGRPSADEAWSMIPRDEADSVFWTEEMAASYGIASKLLNEGDQVAARRAFIDRYTFLVAEARRNGVPVKVTPSWGTDPGGRQAAVDKAVAQGILPPAQAQKFLPMVPNSSVPQIANDLADKLLLQ